jgi:hypothetical protein
LKANCEGQEENAVNFVKTRLTGKARLAVTDDIRNLDEIIQILKQKCSGEKSHTIEAKLLELVPTVMIDDLDKSGAKAEPNFNK